MPCNPVRRGVDHPAARVFSLSRGGESRSPGPTFKQRVPGSNPGVLITGKKARARILDFSTKTGNAITLTIAFFRGQDERPPCQRTRSLALGPSTQPTETCFPAKRRSARAYAATLSREEDRDRDADRRQRAGEKPGKVFAFTPGLAMRLGGAVRDDRRWRDSEPVRGGYRFTGDRT